MLVPPLTPAYPTAQPSPVPYGSSYLSQQSSDAGMEQPDGFYDPPNLLQNLLQNLQKSSSFMGQNFSPQFGGEEFFDQVYS